MNLLYYVNILKFIADEMDLFFFFKNYGLQNVYVLISCSQQLSLVEYLAYFKRN